MPDNSLDSLRKLNELCSRFEGEIRAGGRPRIDEMLAEVEPHQRGALLHVLLQQEWAVRRQRLEAFELSEYLGQFPELRGAVESAWGIGSDGSTRRRPDRTRRRSRVAGRRRTCRRCSRRATRSSACSGAAAWVWCTRPGRCR